MSPTIDCGKRDPTNQTAITAVKNFANDLANRFNPIVGCTRSWDTTDPTDFEVCIPPASSWKSSLERIAPQVIIDNMMNLEVCAQFTHDAFTFSLTDYAMIKVFFASNNLEKNDTLVQMAISHADKTMQNHVREDGKYAPPIRHDPQESLSFN